MSRVRPPVQMEPGPLIEDLEPMPVVGRNRPKSSIKNSIKERDGHRCVYCGAHEDDEGVVLTVDHVKPRSKGGTNRRTNLVTACQDCNWDKGDDETIVPPPPKKRRKRR